MKDTKFEKLFVFEMANNHMGDLEHGLKIIRSFAEVKKKYSFNFGFKLQYRDLDSFIHHSYKGRKDIKYVKRFEETRLAKEDFKKLKDEMVKQGFLAICTPFDENSVDLVVEQGFDIIKVASCSFTDWPLLEKVAKTDKPVILSTAGATLAEIDSIAAFFEHRNKQFALMHCVGEYPTVKENYELHQIGFFRKRYPSIPIGFSTHEAPGELASVKMAISEGAEVFERHVGLKTDKYSVNAYSSTPEQIDAWLSEAKDAFVMSGVKGARRSISGKEKEDLDGLKRGVFAKQNFKIGEKLTLDKVYFAIPSIPGQLLANELSKYTEFTAKTGIEKDAPALTKDFETKYLRSKFQEIGGKIKELVLKSNVPLPAKFEYELSHHFGIDKFDKFGCVIIRCINREYCKTIIVVLPGQSNPIHAHKRKEETFQVLYGDLIIEMNGESKEYKRGDLVVVEREVKHSFTSKTGAVFEEVSTTHYKDDSFYDDDAVTQNTDRKSNMTFWSDWMEDPRTK